MAIFRCFLISGSRSLSSRSKLLSPFSLVNPFSPPSPPNPVIPITNPAVLPSSLFSRSAISIHPPHNTLILSHPYASRSDPPQTVNPNPKLDNSDSNSDSETLIKRECKKEPPSFVEIKFVKRLFQLGMTPEELEYFRMKSTLTGADFCNAWIEVKKNPKHAVKEFHKMLADGVAPNADTYTVLIKKLADDGDEGMLKEAEKSLLEMVEKGMKPSVVAYTGMFEALVKLGKEAEAREMAEMMKRKGLEFDEKRVREILKWKIKIGDFFARDVISILFGK